MAAPGRLAVLQPLPPLGAFRRALAVDRAGPPRLVALSFPPAEVTDDPARLDALLQAVELAGRLRDPAAACVLGTETVDGALAVVEEFRPGTTLRALLDAAGRTPPDVAARVGVDVAAALARVHAAGGPPGAGSLDAARIVIGDAGEVSLCGFGLFAASDAAADLRALGAVLHECLAGEPAGDPPRRLDVPGIPPALAATVDRAAGAASPPYATAALLAAAVGEAVAAPATATDVGAYVDAVLPPGEGERAAVRAALEGALGVVVEEVEPEPPRPREPDPAPVPLPGKPVAPSPDAVATFARPPPPARSARLPLVVGAVALAVGFGAGFAAQRALRPGPPARPAAPVEARAVDPSPAIVVRPERPAEPDAAEAPPRPPASPAAPPGARPPRRAPPPAREPAAKGRLDVTAPADADVLLDGRRVGRGDVKLEVPAGPHRIEVRRAGAVVRERFTVAPGEVWTYSVTPEAAAPAPAAAPAAAPRPPP